LIEWNDEDKLKKKKFQMHEDGDFKPLLFKLSSQNDNFAKFVTSPSTGNYFVIVREDWCRDENMSGSAPVVIPKYGFPVKDAK
jgi:hypothetical protein